ncbi:hypothetical protein [Sphingomonas jatrophae]|uniref:UrcA family protein n=1 Tax=Sphingomonas jatrophae TaxID=1166337 RepID=A0A1I6L1J1_9SPHN|nr:hypothetical protein [Sphingomonas jatrophae]SFR97316.1 hypothetical protein SAMN05192580_2150 [Sphingomonas jatrophae]
MIRIVAAAAALSLWPAAASAQDPVMALDPTTMVGHAGVVAAGEYARQRSGGSSRAGVSAADRRQVRSICTNLGWYAKRPRATPEKMRKLTAMCRQAGY